MALTPEERMRIKDHLGWPNPMMIQTFILGVPAAREPLFILEGAMNAINPIAESRVRQTLERLDRIEELIDIDADTLILSKADEVEIDPEQFEKLLKRYAYWQGKLCNFLGVPGPNPWDARLSAWNGLGGGSMNIPVMHG